MKKTLVAAALLGALLTGAPASAAPGALSGAGAGPPSGGLCGGAVAVAVVGVNVSGDLWVISGTAVINPAGPCTIHLAHVTALGVWHASSGGCIAGAAGSVCVGPVPSQLTPTNVTVTICPPILGGCVSAQATVVRA